MIDALINGKLIKDTVLRSSANGNNFCNFILTVSTGEPIPMVITGIAFNEAAEKIAKLKKGDALTVTGALKPNEWKDKATGDTRHGLNITVSDCLTIYDVKKRR